MSLHEVQHALLTAAGRCLDGWPLAEENKSFQPQGGGRWAALHFLPKLPSAAALGEGGADEVRGLLQIDLNYPAGLGAEQGCRDFEHIRQCFHAGARFTHAGQSVLVVNCGRAAGLIVGGCYRVPVTISWFAHIERC
ncbi:MAG: DUF4128 domain-containing protein [Candidatus Adiutrix sp.]|jgi:hypothetical protein|nr:DUF4128 domain-containing protein [Candidatus Adiutrix sp.]